MGRRIVVVVRTWTDDQLVQATITACNISDICKALGLVPRGGNYQSVRMHARRLGLDLDDLRKNPRKANKPRGRTRSLDEILVEHSTYQDTTLLKNRLWDAGLLDRRCYECGITRWRDQPAPLELEHINGVKDDHRLTNLTILCPNCHALTGTYRGRNKEPRVVVPCQRCEVPISGKRYCKRCEQEVREASVAWPPVEDLLLRAETGSYSQLAREIGVTSHTIRSRIERLTGSPAPAKTTGRRSNADIDHGTRSGYQAERRRGLEACEPCRQANAKAARDDYQRRARA